MHQHIHGQSEEFSQEKALALLAYMLDHNHHHADELHDLAHSFEGQAAELIHDAVASLNASNDKIAQALELLQPEENAE